LTEGIDVVNDAALEAMRLRERVALATAAAMFVAGVLLMAAVLPAEYGVDPLGTGKLFGLTSIAQAAAEQPAAAGAAAGTEATELEPVRPGANVPQAALYKRDKATFNLGPYEGIEYKYKMQKGGGMIYSWKATGKVRFDFHGEPEGAAKGYAESYEMGEKLAADGAFFAPTSGIHGWFWENLSTDDITVTVTSAGFYSKGIEFTADGQKIHQVSAVE
jgi:hypothetical protein